MATIQDLAEMALEELAKADRDGLIPNQIKFHRSGDAVKPWSHMGDYDDHGNFCGSLTMFLLLFPSEYGLIEEGNFKLLDCLNGCGDREEPLRFEGKIYQKSGKGQNNYRTNLLEALLAYIVVPDGMKKYLGLLWLHVLVSVIEISDAEPSCWEWSQERWIKYMLAAKSDQQVTADENKVFAVKTCTHLQLDLFHYYPLVLKLVDASQIGTPLHCYADIRMVCGCSLNSAKQLWDCLVIIQKWQPIMPAASL